MAQTKQDLINQRNRYQWERTNKQNQVKTLETKAARLKTVINMLDQYAENMGNDQDQFNFKYIVNDDRRWFGNTLLEFMNGNLEQDVQKSYKIARAKIEDLRDSVKEKRRQCMSEIRELEDPIARLTRLIGSLGEEIKNWVDG